MATPAEIVTARLQSYAERGVFRGFGIRRLGRDRHEFRFSWLTDRPFRILFDPGSGVLTVRDLLPEIPFRSSMDRELRRFVQARFEEPLPEHRRLDPERIDVRCRNRHASVSLVVTSKDEDWAYTVRKTLALVNEIFFLFLGGPYEEYMVRVFDTPEE